MVKFNQIKSKLKYKPIYKEIDLNDGYEPIKVLINPSDTIKDKMIKIIMKDSNKESIDITDKDVFITIVKLLTEIQFENKQEEQEFMDFLFKEPSKEAEELRDAIVEAINQVLTEFMKRMDKMFNNIDEKELEEIIKMSEREND